MKDVVSLEYKQGKKLLEDEGYQLQIRYTKPFSNLVALAEQRIIGQRFINDKIIELIVSHENFQSSKFKINT